MEKPMQEYEAPNRGEQFNSGTNQDTDFPAEKDTAPDHYPTETWNEDSPIPVYIVRNAPEIPQLNNWSSERFTISENPVEVAGSKRSRTRMIVKCEKSSTNEVYIDRDQSVTTAFSFVLEPGEQIELKHNDRVWARCATTETALVSVIQEYDVSLDIERHV